MVDDVDVVTVFELLLPAAPNPLVFFPLLLAVILRDELVFVVGDVVEDVAVEDEEVDVDVVVVIVIVVVVTVVVVFVVAVVIAAEDTSG